MRWLDTLVTPVLLLSTPAIAAPTFWPFGGGSGGVTSALDGLVSKGLDNLKYWDLRNFKLGGCNYVKAILNPRKEWRQLSSSERKDFTDAVACLMTKPSALAGNSAYPGVKSRYDDYVALHIETAAEVHFSATFLSWHRYVIWAFEYDLQKMCGYRGSLPYWDFGLDAGNIQGSSVFNGDAYSMGSNGAYVKRDTPIAFRLPLTPEELQQLPPGIVPPVLPAGTGTGGGCLTGGPFSKSQAHLGPNLLVAYGNATGLGSMAYNPRCIKRDLNQFVAGQFLTYDNITNLITQYTTVENFQAKMQADPRYPFTKGDFGLHAGGHLGVGGDPFADQPSTVGDPIWFLHHAQLDRVWSIWQQQDLTGRLFSLSGGSTLLNIPPSPPVTTSDTMDLKYVRGAGPQKIGDLLNTIRGPFCYIYK